MENAMQPANTKLKNLLAFFIMKLLSFLVFCKCGVGYIFALRRKYQKNKNQNKLKKTKPNILRFNNGMIQLYTFFNEMQMLFHF
jgi:hypothetical protein